jgi:hypothetical protein
MADQITTLRAAISSIEEAHDESMDDNHVLARGILDGVVADLRALIAELEAQPKAERDALAAEVERLRIPMNRWVVQSIKQEAETALVIGDEIGMRDGLTQILKECDAALGISTTELKEF